MTNYNERLDDILRDHRGRVLTYHELFRRQHHNPHRLDEDLTHAYAVAKQAITSLIKELVAEAKPKEHIDVYTYSNAKTNDDIRKIAIDEFEQNLLKVLEEL